MTKRSKLSLSSPNESTRKQPSSFEVGKAPPKSTQEVTREPPARAAAAATAPPRVSVSPPTSKKRADISPQSQPAWFNSRTIAKAVLIVGAAALSIFLLKRRPF